VLARLDHPNVAMLLITASRMKSITGDGICRRDHLDARLANGALPQKTVIKLGVQLAKGLAAAHREQIIHRCLSH